jgi:hypothetical protein
MAHAHSCSFHAYTGDTPCPWCAEKAGVTSVEPFKPAPGACKFCGSPEMRLNSVAMPPYRWCAACGRRADKKPIGGDHVI